MGRALADELNHRRIGAWIAVGAALLFFVRLGASDLWAPDEPRFAAVAEELRSLPRGMVDLVVLRLNGEVYTQKPPLYYWMAASLGSLTGRVSELDARVPSALAGLLCIALCIRFGRALSGRAAVGLWSGAVLLTVFRFAHLARRAQLDVLLTLFCTLSLFAFWKLQQGAERPKRWIALLHGGLGLATLTKGPVGLLPFAVMIVWLLWERRRGEIRRLFPIWGVALSLGPILAWLALAVALAPPGFFADAVVDNVWGRFFSGTSHIRPIYYYFYQFPIDFLPWTLLWPMAFSLAWRRVSRAADAGETRESAATRFLLVWIGVLFAFFTFSAGKRGLYLLPSYPALAMLCGLALDRGLKGRRALPISVISLLGSATLFLTAAGLGIALSGGIELERYPGFALSRGFGLLLAGVPILGWISGVVLTRRRASVSACLATAFAAILLVEMLVLAVAYPAFDPEKSPRPIAEAAAALTPPGQPIAIYDQRELTGGVAYYSRRPVAAVKTLDEAADYFARGGDAMIVRERKLGSLTGLVATELHASFRSGSRKLMLLVPDSARPSRE
jgi:4-amino-4-deoxy-L-arabinose transferase-like glycosyltransferase